MSRSGWASALLDEEKRPCPSCGRRVSFLKIWPDDTVCAACSAERRAAKYAAINAAKPYRVVDLGGMVPTQAEGAAPSGRPFYFRARHGDWSLEVGRHGDPVGDYLNWTDYTTIAEGDDPTGGCMDDEEVLAVLDEHLENQ